jgi:hypothetical protein
MVLVFAMTVQVGVLISTPGRWIAMRMRVGFHRRPAPGSQKEKRAGGLGPATFPAPVEGRLERLDQRLRIPRRGSLLAQLAHQL